MLHPEDQSIAMFLLMAVALACFAAIGGCGFNSGALRAGEPAYSAKGVQHLRSVEGTSEYKSVLCVYPLSNSRTYKNAVLKMHQMARLQADESFVNLRVDTQTRFYGVWCKYATTVSADVVRLHFEGERKFGDIRVVSCADPVECKADYKACVTDCTNKSCKKDCKMQKESCLACTEVEQ